MSQYVSQSTVSSSSSSDVKQSHRFENDSDSLCLFIIAFFTVLLKVIHSSSSFLVLALLPLAHYGRDVIIFIFVGVGTHGSVFDLSVFYNAHPLIIDIIAHTNSPHFCETTKLIELSVVRFPLRLKIHIRRCFSSLFIWFQIIFNFYYYRTIFLLFLSFILLHFLFFLHSATCFPFLFCCFIDVIVALVVCSNFR